MFSNITHPIPMRLFDVSDLPFSFRVPADAKEFRKQKGKNSSVTFEHPSYLLDLTWGPLYKASSLPYAEPPPYRTIRTKYIMQPDGTWGLLPVTRSGNLLELAVIGLPILLVLLLVWSALSVLIGSVPAAVVAGGVLFLLILKSWAVVLPAYKYAFVIGEMEYIFTIAKAEDQRTFFENETLTSLRYRNIEAVPMVADTLPSGANLPASITARSTTPWGIAVFGGAFLGIIVIVLLELIAAFVWRQLGVLLYLGAIAFATFTVRDVYYRYLDVNRTPLARTFTYFAGMALAWLLVLMLAFPLLSRHLFLLDNAGFQVPASTDYRIWFRFGITQFLDLKFLDFPTFIESVFLDTIQPIATWSRVFVLDYRALLSTVVIATLAFIVKAASSGRGRQLVS